MYSNFIFPPDHDTFRYTFRLISDLMSIVAPYFGSNMGFAERKEEATAIFVHNAILLVSNL